MNRLTGKKNRHSSFVFLIVQAIHPDTAINRNSAGMKLVTAPIELGLAPLTTRYSTLFPSSFSGIISSGSIDNFKSYSQDERIRTSNGSNTSLPSYRLPAFSVRVSKTVQFVSVVLSLGAISNLTITDPVNA